MKYKLSTEKVNEYGFKVLTSGITVPEDTNIPVLFNHDPDKVLGKWDNFIVENDILLAEPILDTDDADVNKISNKIDKGMIDGISIGFTPVEYDLLEDGTVLVTKSVLKEASITPLPANTDARIELNEDYLITFSLNGCDINKIKEELSVLHNNKEKLIKEKLIKNDDTSNNTNNSDNNSDNITNNDNNNVSNSTDKTDDKKAKKAVVRKPRKKTVKKTVKEDKLSDEFNEDMITLADRLITSLNIELSENDNKYTKIILSINDMIKDKDNTINELSEKVTTFENELLNLKEKTKQDNISTYLNLNIKNGKITQEQYKEYYELSLIDFNKVKNLIDKLSVTDIPTIKLTDNIVTTDEHVSEKDFEWYQKHDPNYLKTLRETNITLYTELKNTYIEKLKK